MYFSPSWGVRDADGPTCLLHHSRRLRHPRGTYRASQRERRPPQRAQSPPAASPYSPPSPAGAGGGSASVLPTGPQGLWTGNCCRNKTLVKTFQKWTQFIQDNDASRQAIQGNLSHREEIQLQLPGCPGSFPDTRGRRALGKPLNHITSLRGNRQEACSLFTSWLTQERYWASEPPLLQVELVIY